MSVNSIVSVVRRLPAALALCAAALVLAPAAHAATIYVPGQFPDLGAAYRAASAGDVIELAAGSHPAQRVPRGTKAVTFRGVRGARVRTLDNSASNVTFERIEVDAGFAKDSGFENHGADHVTFRDAAIGNVADEKGAVISGSHFTFDNVLLHDAIMTPGGEDSGVHMECVYAIVVPHFTVRNSTFRDCSVMDLFFTYGNWWDPLPPAYGNVTIENNVFAHPERASNRGWHYYGLYVYLTADGGGTFDGWVVRNNTFENDARIEPPSGSNSRWVGNVGTWDCVSGVTYRHNVGKRCGPTDTRVSPDSSEAGRTAGFGWVDPANMDFRLDAGSPAIGAADPRDAPRLDRDGYARDARPDAGAHEFGAGPPVGRKPGGTVMTARLARTTICRRARRNCRSTAKLRIRATARTRVAVRVLRLRDGERPRVRRSFAVRVRGARTVRIRARSLGVGRYRVVAATRDAAAAVATRSAFKLRVRR